MSRICVVGRPCGALSLIVLATVFVVVSLSACGKDTPTKPATGACCLASSSCQIVSASDCSDMSGAYRGDNTACDPNPCLPVQGACCSPAGICTITAQAACSGGSTWMGASTVCAPNPCPRPGACCAPAGACTLATETACPTGSIWKGAGTVCDPNPCAIGACCAPAGTCTVITQVACAAESTWKGAGTVCDATICQLPQRACCAPAGTCTLTIQAACTGPNNWLSAETACSPNPCPAPSGACCAPAGTCIATTQSACAAPSTWQGVGTVCVPNTCQPPTSATCCAPAGTCTVTMQAACIAPNTWGAAAECDLNPCPQPLPAPTFDPDAGTYDTPQQVAIHCDVEGADIRYTTNGSDPTLSSDLYLNAIPVDRPTTLRAKAYKADRTPSPVSSAAYSFTCAELRFDPPAGTYDSPQRVAITCATPGVAIHYTTDGSAPTASSPVYGDSITVIVNTTLTAIAMRAAWTSSQIATADYVIVQALPAPTILPLGGNYAAPQQLILSCAVDGAEIHYTTDGSEPSCSSVLYAGPLDVSAVTTIRAKACKDGWTSSRTSSATYAFTCAVPDFTPPGETYGAIQNVVISSGSPGVTIHYTTNGGIPTVSDSVYARPIVVESDMTLKAIAVREDWTSSPIGTAVYTMLRVPTPILNPPGRTYVTEQQVTITDSMPEATIRYTTNGSEPDLSSPAYVAPIVIAANKTLKAKAFRAGWLPSRTATGIYIIGLVYDFNGWDGNFVSNAGWQHGTPTVIDAHSSPDLWAMSLSGGYGANRSYVLLSPRWHLTENAELSFWHWHSLGRWHDGGHDVARVYISPDNGANWTVLTNDEGVSDYAYDEENWKQVTYDLSAYANQDVMIKYYLWAGYDYWYCCNTGWFLDDVQVTHATEVSKRGDGR